MSKTARTLWDLAAFAGTAVVASVAIIGHAPLLARVPLALLLLLVLPGLALMAALYPERRGPSTPDGPPARGLGTLERIAFGLGASAILAPLLGLALDQTVGLAERPVALAFLAFVAVLCGIAALRRVRLAPEERGSPPTERVLAAWRSAKPVDKGLAIAFGLCLVLAGLAVVDVLVKPRAGSPRTELYLLGPTGNAYCYPAVFVDGAYNLGPADLIVDCPVHPSNVTIGVVNHEGRTSTYWLRIVWTRELRLEDNSTQVLEAVQGGTQSFSLPSTPVRLELGGAFEPQYEAVLDMPSPPFSGTQRLTFQLFRGDAPPPDIVGADIGEPLRRVHLWIERP